MTSQNAHNNVKQSHEMQMMSKWNCPRLYLQLAPE